MSAELAGKAYVEMSVKGQEQFSKAFTNMQASIRTFSARLASVGKGGLAGIGGVTNALGSMKSMLTGVVGKIGAAGAALGLAFGFSDAIQKASDLQETMNKFNVVFGSNAKEMEAWGITFSKQMGRSKQQVMEFMSNAQGLIVPMGVDPGQAQEMSKTLTQLSFDLASFHNSTDAEAFQALRSALTGESEPMKKFGVIVNETAVKAELLKKGLDPTTANEAQKAMARYNIILEGTRQAQGDVERSGDSFANRLKALQASWDDLSAGIGTAFLPVAEALLGWFKELIESLGMTDQATAGTAAGLDALGQSTNFATTAAGYIVKAWAGVDLAFNLLMGTARTLMRDLLYLFKLMINNPLSKGVFGKETIDNLVAIVDEVDAATAKLQEANRQSVEKSWDTLMDPNAGANAINEVQDWVKASKEKYQKQTEAIKKAREEAKAQAAGQQEIDQPGLRALQELAAKKGGTPVKPSEQPQPGAPDIQVDALNKAADQAAQAVEAASRAKPPGAEKAPEKAKPPKVALTDLGTIKDLKLGQPVEAGAAKQKEEKKKEVQKAQEDFAAKTVQVASPQTLESTSMAAYDKFRENQQNEQKAILEKQLEALKAVAKELADPNIAIVEVE